MKKICKVSNRLFYMNIVILLTLLAEYKLEISIQPSQPMQYIPQQQPIQYIQQPQPIQYIQQPQPIMSQSPNFLGTLASLFSNISLNPQMRYQPMMNGNYSAPPAVIYPTPFARSLELNQNNPTNEIATQTESENSEKVTDEHDYTGTEDQNTKISEERKKLIDLLEKFLKDSKRHTFRSYLKLKLFFENYIRVAESSSEINHQEYLYLTNLEKYILYHNYYHNVMNFKNIKSHMTIIINGEENETVFHLSQNYNFAPRTDYFQFLASHDPEYQKEIGNPLSKKDSEEFTSDYSDLMKYLHLEKQWHSDLKDATKNRSSKIRKRELKRQIADGQTKIRNLCKELNDFIKLNKFKKFSDEENKKLKVIKYLLRLIHEHKLGSFYIKLSSFYYDMGFNLKKHLKKRHKKAIRNKVEVMRHELSPLSFYTSVFRIIHQYNYLIPSIINKLSNHKQIGDQISKLSKDPRERAILKSFFDVFSQRLIEIAYFLFDEDYKNYFQIDAQKIVKSVLSPSSLEEFIQFNANIDLLFVQIGKIEVHLHKNKNLPHFSKMRQKYFGFFEVLIVPMLEAEPNFNLEKIKKEDKKFFEDVRHVKTFQKLINKHLRSHKIANISESDFEKNDGNDVLGDSMDKYLNSQIENDIEGQSVQDYFYEDGKHPKNRHDGSEISGQVDLSEIEEIDAFKNELDQEEQSLSSSNSKQSNNKVIAPHHRKKEESDDQSELSRENDGQDTHTTKIDDQEVIVNESSSNVKNSQEDLIDNDSDKTEEVIDLKQYETSDGEDSSIEKIDLKKATSNQDSDFELIDQENLESSLSLNNATQETNNEQQKTSQEETETSTTNEQITETTTSSSEIIEHSSSKMESESTTPPINTSISKIPVKVHKKTVVNKVWENGGFKPLKKKYGHKDFEKAEDEIDHMIVTMDQLQKVKIDKMIVLKSKIISELFMNFFSEMNDKDTLILLNDSQMLNRNGLIRKDTGQRLNYLLMITVEGRLMRKKIVDNTYFSQIIEMWKIFVLEYASSCQLKLYIELMRRMQGIDKGEYVRVWKNFIKFLHSHQQYQFITCPKMIINIWMDKSILPGRIKTAKQIASIFTKTFFRYNKHKQEKAIAKKKILVKKILDKIQMKSSHDPIFNETNKIALFQGTTPGNKLNTKDPINSSAIYSRKPDSPIHHKIQTDVPNYSKAHLYSITSPGNKINENDYPDFPEYNYSSEFRNIFKKKTMDDILNGHLQKIKLKANKDIDNETVNFTKSLVVGTLLDGKSGQPSINSLAKISFKLDKKDINYIKKLELEYRNVDNIRIAKHHDNIFTNLRKIFFKPREDDSDDDESPPIDPPYIEKKMRRKYKKRIKKKGGCKTRIFKKCKCEGNGTGTSTGSGGTGCCGGDGNVGDDSVYNYRPQYDFRFEFDNPEEMAQFEEFLRSTEAIDKLLSSNMIDVAKAQKEFEKAQTSKHFDITVNGKKITPDDLLVPKNPTPNSPQSNNPDEDPHENSSNPNDHPSNDEDDEDPDNSSPKKNDTDNKKIGLDGLGTEIPIKTPFNPTQWNNDLNNLDLDVRNQPSIEDAIRQSETPVDEDGNPINVNPEDVADLKKKSDDAQLEDDELEEFIKRNKPIIEGEESHPTPEDDMSQVESDEEVESVIHDDLDAREDTKSSNSNPTLDNLDTHDDDENELIPVKNSKLNNKMIDPLDFEPDQEDSLDDGNHNPSNPNLTIIPNSLDNVYSDKLLDKVENDLKNKEPMRPYRFGKNDWQTDQVYTNDIKDEGIYGASINKYPAMSDAMKERLNKEIMENGGYPDESGDVQIPAKMQYSPFQVDHEGDVHWAPQPYEKYLI